MKPFRERNPVVIGAIGVVVLALMLAAAFRADSLPVIGGGDTYYAAFSEAGGLETGDPVRIAGVRVGKVQAIELDGDHVRVTFKVDTPSQFGTGSAASIRVRTLLGSMYLAVEPQGGGQLSEGTEIPLARTTAPYDVVEAFEGLSTRAQDIDTDQLASSLETLARATRDTPEEFQQALDGVSRLSQNIAAKDEQLNTLLQNLQNVAGVLDSRDQQLVKLMEDADVLFRALVRRREAIHRLLVSTSELSKQLTALVRQSREDLKPALDNLENVVDVLLKNQDNIDNSLRLFAPFIRVFANTLGNGPWFDVYVPNLPPVPELGTNPLGGGQ